MNNVNKLRFLLSLLLTANVMNTQEHKSTSCKTTPSKDSLFYKAAEDMLIAESLVIGLPLIGYQSLVATPVTIAGVASLVGLKLYNPKDKTIETQEGLVTAALPITICTIGLKTGFQAVGLDVGLPESAASCGAIYTAFLAAAAIKK